MKKLLAIFAAAIVLATSYYTYRLFVFAGKVSKAFEYTYAAIDCLIQENGQNEDDVNILFKGYRSRQGYADAANKEYPGMYKKDSPLLVRKIYNDQIPECHVFYSQYRCWMLDIKDSKSLDNCGKKFELTQEEIDAMKKNPPTAHKVFDDHFKRLQKEQK